MAYRARPVRPGCHSAFCDCIPGPRRASDHCRGHGATWQVKLGGDESLDARAYRGLKITAKDPAFIAQLPEKLLPAGQSDNSAAGRSLRELLGIRCDVHLNLNEGDEDDALVVWLMQGGDLAAFHAAFALASPVDRVSGGCCARCNLTKPKWTDAEACARAWRRTFAYQCVANHVNVFELRGFREAFPGHAPPVCPHCNERLTVAFCEKERLEFQNATDAQREDILREHIRTHLGGVRGGIPILPMEHRSRAESALHARTNATANNISVTFMAVPFSKKMRKEGNALLKAHGIFWRLPENKTTRRIRPVQGNDSRAFHTNPELLVGLFDIFYPGAPDELLTGLAQAAAGAEDVRESHAEQAKASGRKRPRKRALPPPAVVGVGGVDSTTVDVNMYRSRRIAADVAARAAAATRAAATASAHAAGAPSSANDCAADDESSEEDADEEGGIQPYELPEDAAVGGVKTALEVWLASIAYQNAAHAKLADPDSADDLRAYAKAGQAAGTAWATAVQVHCNYAAPWQYVHRAFAHFEEDALENGHRDSTDDSLLEKGNRSVKEHKGNVFQGGTNEAKYVEQTHHHQTEAGLWYESKSKKRRMPTSVAAQTFVRTHAAQWFAEDRPRPQDTSAKRKRQEVVKHEKDAGKRTVTEAALVEYKKTKVEAVTPS